jgi:hypothetical protein
MTLDTLDGDIPTIVRAASVEKQLIEPNAAEPQHGSISLNITKCNKYAPAR